MPAVSGNRASIVWMNICIPRRRSMSASHPKTGATTNTAD